MSEWIRSLGGLDAPSRAVELWMADDEVTADAVVDEAARDVANATTQAAMVDLLRDRSRNVAKILGIDKEVDGRDATPFQSIYCTKHELPLETYRFSPESYAFGIESVKMKDGQTKVYSIEKTKTTAKPESRKEAIISIRRLLEPVVFAGSGHGAKWSPADDIKSGDEVRWKQYVRGAIIEPSITLDILNLDTVAKPELLRQTFALGCTYAGKILSYQKMVAQLQDAGNTTTIAHYLRLLGEAGLLTGLEKLYDEPVRVRASSPKLAVCNNALRTAMQTCSPSAIRADPERWGHAVESAIGAQLLSSVRRKNIDLLYWNVGCKEVDYVLRRDDAIAAIEVKSSDADSVSGMHEFLRKYPRSKSYLIGGQGMPLETAFATSAADLI